MITDFMTGEHRHCDQLFALAESAANDDHLDGARSAYAEFEAALLGHLDMEEQVLFPAFEARTGMNGGPTAVMRMEHEQMRAVLGQMQRALAGGSMDDFLGLAETLNVLIQQHNMKEEHMLYPMTDRALAGEAGAIIERMRAL
ncbi:MAG: hemerythrin domain-containing protein [Gammaproteobacteria bacterium]|nr:hemerythrin domain-containing protein [Gammaproteobacteria bacterium]